MGKQRILVLGATGTVGRPVMTGFGLPRVQVLEEVAACEALRATGDAQPPDVMARVAGQAPTSFRQYAAEAAAGGAWAPAGRPGGTPGPGRARGEGGVQGDRYG